MSIDDETLRVRQAALLQRILRGGTSGDKEAEEDMLPALDELSDMRIENKRGALDILLQVAHRKGGTEPEGTLLSRILANLCKEDESCLRALIEAVETPGNKQGLLACLPSVIKGLNDKGQEQIAPALISRLRQSKELSEDSRGLLPCLQAVSQESARKKMAALLNADLDLASPSRILLAISAARRISNKDNLDSVVKVLRRSNSGWYKQLTEQVQAEASYYLIENPSPLAGVELLSVLRKSNRQEALNAFAACATKGLVDTILDEIEGLLRAQHDNPAGWDYTMANNLCRILDDVDSALVDIQRFTSMEGLGYLPTYLVQDVIVRAGSPSKPFIIELLKKGDQTRYAIAVSCLNQLGIPFEDIIDAFTPPATVQIIDYFFRESTPSLLWKKKESLGNPAPLGKFTKFDLLAYNLLTSFNFITVYADPAGKRGVDIVGFAPIGLWMVVGGATTGILKNDLQNLQSTVDEMSATMPNLLSRFDVFKVLFTSTGTDYGADLDYARRHKIVILGPAEIDEMIQMSLTGRKAQDFINYLASKRTILS